MTELNRFSDKSDFPSEILEGLLYLGSAKSACSEEVMKHLGITHVLNVSDDIPNYFETNSKRQWSYSNVDCFNINYENIFIEDTEDAPIHHYFSRAFNFIDQALFPKSVGGEALLGCANADSEHDLVFGELATVTLKLELETAVVSAWQEDETKCAAFDVDVTLGRLRQAQPQGRVLVHCAMGKSRSATMITMYLMKKFLLPYKLARNIVKTRRETVEINNGFIGHLETFGENDLKYHLVESDNDSESTEGEEAIVC